MRAMPMARSRLPWSATLSGSNGTIFYPYFGSSAVAIRAAVTGNVYAEII
jgi:hypothetical protein